MSEHLVQRHLRVCVCLSIPSSFAVPVSRRQCPQPPLTIHPFGVGVAPCFPAASRAPYKSMGSKAHSHAQRRTKPSRPRERPGSWASSRASPPAQRVLRVCSVPRPARSPCPARPFAAVRGAEPGSALSDKAAVTTKASSRVPAARMAAAHAPDNSSHGSTSGTTAAPSASGKRSRPPYTTLRRSRGEPHRWRGAQPEWRHVTFAVGTDVIRAPA